MLTNPTRLGAAAIVIVAILAPPPAASSSSGSGMIHCLIAIGLVEFPCDPDLSGADVMTRPAGNYPSVTLTLSWIAQSEAATHLRLTLMGNTSCTSDPDCFSQTVEGQSPLTVTLVGDAAQGADLKAWLSLKAPCRTNGLLAVPTVPPETDRVACETVPAKIVREQPFEYEWND